MNRSGFTLTELIIILALIGILTSIGFMDFSGWQKRSNVDKQIKELYTDIMSIRQMAVTTKMNHRIVLGTATTENPVLRYTLNRYSSVGDPGRQLLVKNVSYPITKTGWASPAANEIEFDERGIMIDPIEKRLCIFSTFVPPLDALVITQTKVGLGKIITQGARNAAACTKANIDLQ